MMSKAIVLKELHSIDKIQIEHHELEDMTNDMIEVKVHYSGVNFADFYTIHGLAGHQVPKILGIECAGIITAVGSDAAPFKVGDKVICYDWQGGIHQSILRIHKNKCYLIPEDMELSLAAAIFVNYLTAWFSLFSIGNFKDGQCVFISSCAGGVGLAAIELIKSLKNIQIYGSASASKRQFLENKGVHFVEYENIENLEVKFDLVIESMSTETRNILMKKLNPFGKMVIIGAKDMIGNASHSLQKDHIYPNIDPIDLIFNNSVVAGVHLGVLADKHGDLIRSALSSIWSRIEPSSVHLNIFPFEEVRDAYNKLSNRQNIGKILLKH